METIKEKSFLVEGPIDAAFIAEKIAAQQTKVNTGAHDIFLGQVRADIIDGNEVKAIEYSAYDEMAENTFSEISKSALEKFNLSGIEIYHSVGRVKAGEICLFVFVSSPRRKMAYKALEYTVEEIKKEIPIFGKELFEDDSYVWKENI